MKKDLSHSVWSRFRLTVRADGLNPFLAVTREQFSDRKELRVFRSFLRACFNKARVEWEKQDKWADSGAAIVERYGMLPLLSLRNFVEDSIGDGLSLEPSFVDVSDYPDIESAAKEYAQATKNDLREVLQTVEFDGYGENAPVAKYSVKSRNVVVNSDHPFVKEHSENRPQREAIKNSVLVDLLTDVSAYDLGIDARQVEEIRQKRDRISRIMAKINRRSGAQIAQLLREVSKHKDFKPLEIVVGDALEFLGFDVKRIGGSGEPEGVAKAKLPPNKNEVPQSYSFSYDAKSSQNGKAQTNNCNVAGLLRHRDYHEVNYILLVAPDFQEGALEEECTKHQVTPIRAQDLGRLLILSAEYGAIPLTKLRDMFEKTTPSDVSQWIDDLEAWLKEKRHLTFANFVDTLGTLEEDFPDVVSVAVLADRCRAVVGGRGVRKDDIKRLVSGLQIIVPDLVQIDGENVIVSAHPNKLADAINAQLQKIKGGNGDGSFQK